MRKGAPWFIAVFLLASAASSLPPKKCPGGGIGAKYHYKCAAGVDTGGTAGASLGGKCYQAGHSEPGGGDHLLSVCIRPDGRECRGGDPGTTIPSIPKFAKGGGKNKKCGKMLLIRIPKHPPPNNSPKFLKGDPININTGEVSDLTLDLPFALPMTSLGLSLIRSYGSHNLSDIGLGMGWGHSFSARLKVLGSTALVVRDPLDGKLYKFGPNIAEDAVEVLDALGQRLRFKRAGSIYTEDPDSEGSTVTPDGSGNFDWRKRNGIVYRFDSAGKLLRITDRRGQAVALTYASGRLATLADPTGRTVYTFSYNASGRISSIMDVAGRVVSYFYTDGLLTKVSGLGGDTVYEYGGESQDLLVAKTEPNGKRTSWTYAPVSFKANTGFGDPGGAGAAFSSDDGCAVVTADAVSGGNGLASPADVDPAAYAELYGSSTTAGSVPVFGAGAPSTPFGSMSASDFSCGVVTVSGGALMAGSPGSGSPSSSSPREKIMATSSQGGSEAFIATPLFDVAQGTQVTTTADNMGRTQSYAMTSVNGHSVVTSFTNALGQTTRFEYDSAAQLVAQTNHRGETIRYAYDANGNPTRITDALGHAVAATWNANVAIPVPAVITDPLGHSLTLTLDGAGLLTTITDNLGHSQSAVYNALGLPSSITDFMGHSATFAYDSYGHLISVRDALNRQTQSVVDSLGRMTSLTRPDNKTVAVTYNNKGKVESVTDALGREFRLSYRLSDSVLTQVRDPKGHATDFQYDNEGRLVRATNILGQSTQLAYNAVGLLASITSPNGITRSTAYDENSRPVRISGGDDAIVFSYDDGKHSLTIENGDSRIEAAYNAGGRLIRSRQTDKKDGVSFVLTYAYDADGKRAALGTPFGSFAYSYDGLDRLVALTNFKNQVFNFTYNDNSLLTAVAFPNGVVTGYVYDQASRLTQINSVRSGVVVSSETLTYDAIDNITQIVDRQGVHQYGYNDISWLESASHPSSSRLPYTAESYAYDLAGNRTSSHQRPVSTFDNANRLISDSSYTYTYDANGNLTARTSVPGGLETRYAYSDAGNLASVTDVASGRKTTYAYDPWNRRIRKVVSLGQVSRKWRYFYDGSQIIAVVIVDKDAAGQETSNTYHFTHAPGVDTPLAIEGAEDYFYQRGNLGSVVALTDSAGSVVERVEYDSFGKSVYIDPVGGSTAPISAIPGNVFGFTSREFEGDTGLYYYRSRYYDPGVGRFIQPDSLFSTNLYAYVQNNPIKMIDPFGTQAVRFVEFPGAEKWTQPQVDGLGKAIASASQKMQAVYDANPTYWGEKLHSGAAANIEDSFFNTGRGCQATQNNLWWAIIDIAEKNGLEVKQVNFKDWATLSFFGHHTIVVYPKGTKFEETGIIIDPAPDQEARPDKIPIMSYQDWHSDFLSHIERSYGVDPLDAGQEQHLLNLRR